MSRRTQSRVRSIVTWMVPCSMAGAFCVSVPGVGLRRVKNNKHHRIEIAIQEDGSVRSLRCDCDRESQAVLEVVTSKEFGGSCCAHQLQAVRDVLNGAGSGMYISAPDVQAALTIGSETAKRVRESRWKGREEPARQRFASAMERLSIVFQNASNLPVYCRFTSSGKDTPAYVGTAELAAADAIQVFVRDNLIASRAKGRWFPSSTLDYVARESEWMRSGYGNQVCPLCVRKVMYSRLRTHCEGDRHKRRFREAVLVGIDAVEMFIQRNKKGTTT